jgi:CheY-like chemotaxis protein
MVFGFVKQSGGHISVYSEEGKGTCFRLYLPRAGAGAEVAAGHGVRTQQMPGGSETVLIVEDNEKLRRIVVRQMTELGYRVREAGNATEALEMLDADPIDLLFTDMVMPGEMNGAELAHAARQRRPQLKVLYTSGFPDAHLGGETRPRDDAELLSKPYRKEELAHMLRQVLDRGNHEPTPPSATGASWR